MRYDTCYRFCVKCFELYDKWYVICDVFAVCGRWMLVVVVVVGGYLGGDAGCEW